MLKRPLLSILFFLVSLTLLGQEKFTVKKDLRSEWLQYKNDRYELIGDETISNIQSIHLQLNADKLGDQKILIQSSKPYFLFLNGKLIKEHQGRLEINPDSLSSAQNVSDFTLTVNQTRIDEKDLKTQLTGNGKESEQFESVAKPNTFFRDFVVIAGLVLIIFFVIIIRMHPKLAADYFSVTRILSLREGEDNQSHARFAISSNLLFYIFGSMLLSLYLIIVFDNLPDNYMLSSSFEATDFWGVVWKWIKLSTLIVVILFCKIVLIFSLSWLFGMNGIAGVHFFNWVRLLLLISSSFIVILFIYYISRGYNPTVYTVLLSAIVFFFTAWIAVVFLKLNNRIEHSMFHLFSYICATEVIPLLITIKVLFQ
jgi:hypothetical protein